MTKGASEVSLGGESDRPEASQVIGNRGTPHHG